MAVKAAENGKYVRMALDFWYDEKDRSIHLASNDTKTFHTTVNHRPDSKRCHENLYKHLQELLAANGKWPEGEA